MSKNPNEVHELLVQLEKRFLEGERSESDEAKMVAFNQFFVEYLRVAKALATTDEAARLILKMADEIISDYKVALPHGIVRQWAGLNFAASAEFFVTYGKWLKEKHAEKSRNAARQRRTKRLSGISQLIADLAAQNPSISEQEVLQALELRSYGYDDVVTEITDSTIYGRGGERVKLSSLRGRVSRAKKNLKRGL